MTAKKMAAHAGMICPTITDLNGGETVAMGFGKLVVNRTRICSNAESKVKQGGASMPTTQCDINIKSKRLKCVLTMSRGRFVRVRRETEGKIDNIQRSSGFGKIRC